MIALYHGKDSYLSLKEAKNQIEKITAEIEDIKLVTIECPEFEPQTIINHLTTQDMFSNSKIVLLKRFLLHKSKETLVEYILDQLNETQTIHFIFWEDHKVPSNTKYFKFFKQAHEYGEMNKPTFYKWVNEVFKDLKIEIDKDAVTLLSHRVNFSTERLVNEANKFEIEGLTKITREIIEISTTDTQEREIWALTEEINKGDKANIMSIYDYLTKQGLDPNYLIAMIARNLRLSYQVKYMDESHKNSKEICSILRIPPFTLPEIQRAARATSWEKYKFVYEKLTSLDTEIKRGNIEPQLGLTLLLSKL